MFDLEKFKLFVKSQMIGTKPRSDCRYDYIEALFQFKEKPSTFLKADRSLCSKFYQSRFNLENKPGSLGVNDWLLFKFGYKHCIDCDEVYSISNFYTMNSRWDKLDHQCKNCRNKVCQEYDNANSSQKLARTNKRRAIKLNARPKWLTAYQQSEITNMYAICKEKSLSTGIPHHVDHIIPLNHDLVCGLDVPWNLQIITAEENVRKSNKFEVI